MSIEKDRLTISVLGCGWLGIPLTQHLVALGHIVKGSTTTKSKLNIIRKLGAEPFLINLDDKTSISNLNGFVRGSNTILINIPPKYKSSNGSDYLDNLKQIVPCLEKFNCRNIIYISSTAVYKDDENFTEVFEDYGPFGESHKSRLLLAAENIFKLNPNFNTTVLRLGGLIGKDRHPAKYLSGRTSVKNPEAPINLVHRKDCINLISNIIQNNIFGEVLNATCPLHPSKEEYYTTICNKLGIAEPGFNSKNNSLGKTVSSQKSLNLKNFCYEEGIY